MKKRPTGPDAGGCITEAINPILKPAHECPRQTTWVLIGFVDEGGGDSANRGTAGNGVEQVSQAPLFKDHIVIQKPNIRLCGCSDSLVALRCKADPCGRLYDPFHLIPGTILRMRFESGNGFLGVIVIGTIADDDFSRKCVLCLQ